MSSQGTEAFNWKTPVTIRQEVFSWEGPAQEGSVRWTFSKSFGYWTTLALEDPSSPSAVPMVSNNSALLLAASSSAKLQTEAGIVFGKIPASSTVHFSGRAERILYYPSIVEGEKIFAMVNAAPGAHLLYLAGVSAVAIPVLNGRATFVDLTKIRYRDLTGRVVDGGSATFKGLKSVSVKVVGHASSVTTTDRSGAFALSRVPVIGDYPVYIETSLTQEFKHRYRVARGSGSNLTLFRFGAQRLDTYLRQLEGGVSPVSGVIIGAFPGLVAKSDRTTLHAKVKPVLPGMPLPPETYGIGQDERLDENAPLNRQSVRSLTVQVPEGLNVAQVMHSSKRVMWSELIIASPGVVNVVGPY